MLAQQIEKMQTQIKALQTKSTKKLYTEQDLCPNPFDKILYMPPFPKHFEAPNFEKYKGKGNPKDHIRGFYVACIEPTYDDTYLIHLFLGNFTRQAMDWYTHLLGNIKSWNELVEKFICHFAFNIDNEITMLDLCNAKQKPGEPLMTFLQRW